jgi:hypothetical protein
MRYQLTDHDRRVKTSAREEHFSTPMQRQKSAAASAFGAF